MLYSTIWLALALFVTGEIGQRRAAVRRELVPWAWWTWTIGALLCAIHMTLALGTRYAWDHAAAVTETARQSAAVYGFSWNGSLYINYVFLFAWIGEAAWWRAQPDSFFERPPFLTWARRAFYATIIVNAAVIFARPVTWTLGVPLVLALLWAWRPRTQSARLTSNSPWPLRLDLISAKALVWVASVGRDADLTPEAHFFFFDRYQRLAHVHKQRGHQAAYERLQAKADEHYRAGGGPEPPYAAAMAMPRPRRWTVTDAVAGRPSSGPDDAA